MVTNRGEEITMKRHIGTIENYSWNVPAVSTDRAQIKAVAPV
jgi:hypothetical protein